MKTAEPTNPAGNLLPRAKPYVVVAGGANVDIKARIAGLATYGTSNPGITTQAAGGVARNIAENLARLGVCTHLIAAVGTDLPGEFLLRQTGAAGVGLENVLHVDNATGTYTAVLDEGGELLLAVAAMEATDHLTPAVLQARQSVIQNAKWVIADGNLSSESLLHLLSLCSQAKVPVFFEPVSVPKAVCLLPALDAGIAPHTVTPNIAELSALVGWEVADTRKEIGQAARQLQAHGIHTVWVRRGKLGSLLYSAGSTSEHPALPATVKDVTGAGDAMLAAYLAALLTDALPSIAAEHGHAAAALTIESTETICPTLTHEAIRMRLDMRQA